jgi:Type II secretion system (T2SS), protein E, N-terminal domain
MSLIHSITTSPWIVGFKAVSCSSDDCSRWLTQRHLSARKVGVKLDGNWYCSYSCFAAAAAHRFAQLLRVDPVVSNRTSRMPLGLILLNRGWITQEQSRQALKTQNESGEEIGEIFVEMGCISEKQLISARSMQWGCPAFAASRPLQNRCEIPIRLMRRHSMVPLHYVSATNSLLVGFVHRIEYGVLYAIEQITGRKTRPCLITASDFELHMREYKDNAKIPVDDLTSQNVQSPMTMAHVLCNYGRLLNADEVVIGRCKGFFWIRMKSFDTTEDVLFRTD